MTIDTEEYTITYPDTPDVQQAVFTRLIKYFTDLEAFSGESICQSDGALQEAPDVLSDIADNILKFKVEWKS